MRSLALLFPSELGSFQALGSRTAGYQVVWSVLAQPRCLLVGLLCEQERRMQQVFVLEELPRKTGRLKSTQC